MQHGTARLGRAAETIWVAAGGDLGAMARHGVEHIAPAASGTSPHFPWATLAINVTGSLALGLVLAWSAKESSAPLWVRPFAGIGFCGAFTTFSTLTCELLLLESAGAWVLAAAYLSASLVLGIGAAALGERIAKSIHE